jgi:nicotinate phosphoribosyltransferase
MEAGARSIAMPSLEDVRAHCQHEQQTLWDEIRRLENPHGYYVDLSQALWQLKQDLIREHAGKPQ